MKPCLQVASEKIAKKDYFRLYYTRGPDVLASSPIANGLSPDWIAGALETFAREIRNRHCYPQKQPLRVHELIPPLKP